MDIHVEKKDNINPDIKMSTNEEKQFIVTKDTDNIIISKQKTYYNNSDVDWSKLTWTMQNL